MNNMWNRETSFGRVRVWVNYSNADTTYTLGVTVSRWRVMLWLGPLLCGVDLLA